MFIFFASLLPLRLLRKRCSGGFIIANFAAWRLCGKRWLVFFATLRPLRLGVNISGALDHTQSRKDSKVAQVAKMKLQASVS
jgi:hypothetical protein